ncbi:MAG: hypothetical protein M3Y08_09560 [Fibrobacterota bacterium]|nr:hypothetical protein [Fibrobacterota bacterium]
MKTMPPGLAHIFALCLSLSTVSCVLFPDDDKTVQGGGSDTETLTGLVSTPTGLPSARTLVKLFPADYDPSRPDTTRIHRAMTDDSGHFRFEKLEKAKAYNVIAGNAGEKSWALASGLTAGPERKTLSLTLAKVFLFSLHSDAYTFQDSGIAYFPGTDIFTRCNSVTASVVDSVPLGALRFVVESRAGWKHETTVISVKDTTEVVASKDGLILYP